MTAGSIERIVSTDNVQITVFVGYNNGKCPLCSIVSYTDVLICLIFRYVFFYCERISSGLGKEDRTIKVRCDTGHTRRERKRGLKLVDNIAFLLKLCASIITVSSKCEGVRLGLNNRAVMLSHFLLDSRSADSLIGRVVVGENSMLTVRTAICLVLIEYARCLQSITRNILNRYRHFPDGRIIIDIVRSIIRCSRILFCRIIRRIIELLFRDLEDIYTCLGVCDRTEMRNRLTTTILNSCTKNLHSQIIWHRISIYAGL